MNIKYLTLCYIFIISNFSSKVAVLQTLQFICRRWERKVCLTPHRWVNLSNPRGYPVRLCWCNWWLWSLIIGCDVVKFKNEMPEFPILPFAFSVWELNSILALNWDLSNKKQTLKDKIIFMDILSVCLIWVYFNYCEIEIKTNIFCVSQLG